MSELILSTNGDLHGLNLVLLENALLRVAILPQLGGKIWQITYKPLAADLLWHNPSVPPALHPLHACYDDLWAGGWDELFPNDEATEFLGHQLPDHGELWTGNFTAEPFHEPDSVGIRLSFVTPVTRFLVERTIRLRAGQACLHIDYRFTNQGAASMPFLWKLHPAFAVGPSHRIDLPPMIIVREPAFEGTLAGAPLEFPWPHAPLPTGSIDLRQVPDAASGALHFFYGVGSDQGWCALTNQATGLAAGLRYDPAVFPTCWLFATHGGWQGLNVAVLEPATGYPFQLDKMVAANRAPWLAPGESLETSVLFTTQTGLQSVSAITASGQFLPGVS